MTPELITEPPDSIFVPSTRKEVSMIVGAVIAIVLLGYLVFTLIKPEKF